MVLFSDHHQSTPLRQRQGGVNYMRQPRTQAIPTCGRARATGHMRQPPQTCNQITPSSPGTVLPCWHFTVVSLYIFYCIYCCLHSSACNKGRHLVRLFCYTMKTTGMWHRLPTSGVWRSTPTATPTRRLRNWRRRFMSQKQRRQHGRRTGHAAAGEKEVGDRRKLVTVGPQHSGDIQKARQSRIG